MKRKIEVKGSLLGRMLCMVRIVFALIGRTSSLSNLVLPELCWGLRATI